MGFRFLHDFKGLNIFRSSYPGIACSPRQQLPGGRQTAPFGAFPE